PTTGRAGAAGVVPGVRMLPLFLVSARQLSHEGAGPLKTRAEHLDLATLALAVEREDITHRSQSVCEVGGVELSEVIALLANHFRIGPTGINSSALTAGCDEQG